MVEKIKLKEKIVNVLNSIPDEMKREFLINTLQSNHSELKIFKTYQLVNLIKI